MLVVVELEDLRHVLALAEEIEDKSAEEAAAWERVRELVNTSENREAP